MRDVSLPAKLGAEFLGTFWLVFGGCGSAVLAAVFLADTHPPTQLGIGFVGVAVAFGLTVVTGIYAFGRFSGGHFNPAVSIGLAVARRFEPRLLPSYILTQLLAATAAAAMLLVVASGRPGFDPVATGFASNGYGDRSPGGYSLLTCLTVEVLLTAVFVYIVLGATDDRATPGSAPLAIGLALTVIHLISVPVTNTSVNPARSLGVAWFAGPAALAQVWLFLVVPIVGAVVAGLTYASVTAARKPAPNNDEGIANNPRTTPGERP